MPLFRYLIGHIGSASHRQKMTSRASMGHFVVIERPISIQRSARRTIATGTLPTPDQD
jgi:hypothetical protein